MSVEAETARRAEIEAAFAAARAEKILDVIGRFLGPVKWARSGDWLRGRCPLCGAGRKGSAPFAVNVRRHTWFCHAEAQGGDAVALLVAAQGVSRLEAARRIAGTEAVTARPTARIVQRDADAEADEARRAERRRRVIAGIIDTHWREAVPATGTPVEAWFASRGLDPAFIPGAFARLRFHPNALAARGMGWEVRAPAMIAEVTAWRTPLGAWRVVAQHCTYLAPDGARKARLFTPDGEALPSRKIWGGYQGGAAWLTDRDETAFEGEPLVVGEGIETLWAWAQLTGRRHARFAAALSLDNFCGRPALDAGGCFDPAAPRRDPRRAAFAAPGMGAVIGLVDRDMSPVEAKVRDGMKRRTRRMLSQDERARIAGSLFRQHWMAAGAREAGAAFPPPGMDFNDQLMAERAA